MILQIILRHLRMNLHQTNAKLLSDAILNTNGLLNIFSKQSKRNYRFTPTMSTIDQTLNEPMEPLKPNKALLLTKFSRYEFEKRRHSQLTEDQLIKILESRGSDYQSLRHHHNINAQSRDHVLGALKSRNIDTKVVNRYEYNEDLINWADIIITSGGDGTFLMAASKINNRNKPVIGVNSDPTRSVGYLCLPQKYSYDFDSALQLLSEGDFKWKFRQRIRVTLESEDADQEPIELHKQLGHPEYRFFELDSQNPEQSFDNLETNNIHLRSRKKCVLPFRSLNEVFIGESLSSRVSYYEFSVNGSQKAKLKSSGLTICTGTGSTSWSFNINKVTPQCVQSIFEIVNEELDVNLPEFDTDLIQRVTDRFNSALIFDASEPTMAFTIRDPIVFGTDFHSNQRGFAKQIELKSRMLDANIVIDGGLSYKFNDGANVLFEILDEDALRTISLKE